MSADKHPAEVLADTDVQTLAEHLASDRAWLRDEYGVHIASMLGAERQLRRIPALEAERVHLRAKLEQRHERQHEAEALAGQYLVQRDDARSERDQLRAEVDALREANSTFATAAILPDDKVIVDKAEIEALRADAERYRWLRSDSQTVTGPCAYGSWMGLPMFNDELDSAIDAARKQQ